MVFNFSLIFWISAAELPAPQTPLGDGDLTALIEDLKKRKFSFVEVTNNEATCREFISPFLSTAVAHVKQSEARLQLQAEVLLSGSRGFGPLDYSVDVEGTIVLVLVAKKVDFVKGAAQNFVQMHSALVVNFFFFLIFTNVAEHC